VDVVHYGKNKLNLRYQLRKVKICYDNIKIQPMRSEHFDLELQRKMNTRFISVYEIDRTDHDAVCSRLARVHMRRPFQNLCRHATEIGFKDIKK